MIVIAALCDKTPYHATSSPHYNQMSARCCGCRNSGTLAVVSVPIVPGTMGFTGARIEASSLPVEVIAAATITSGGGVIIGSLMITL